MDCGARGGDGSETTRSWCSSPAVAASRAEPTLTNRCHFDLPSSRPASNSSPIPQMLIVIWLETELNGPASSAVVSSGLEGDEERLGAPLLFQGDQSCRLASTSCLKFHLPSNDHHLRSPWTPTRPPSPRQSFFGHSEVRFPSLPLCFNSPCRPSSTACSAAVMPRLRCRASSPTRYVPLQRST